MQDRRRQQEFPGLRGDFLMHPGHWACMSRKELSCYVLVAAGGSTHIMIATDKLPPPVAPRSKDVRIRMCIWNVNSMYNVVKRDMVSEILQLRSIDLGLILDPRLVAPQHVSKDTPYRFMLGPLVCDATLHSRKPISSSRNTSKPSDKSPATDETPTFRADQKQRHASKTGRRVH
jgi:hypothetical protein